MTLSQYRCLTAHLYHFNRGLDEAMEDCGITDSKEDVLDELFKTGHTFDRKADKMLPWRP